MRGRDGARDDAGGLGSVLTTERNVAVFGGRIAVGTHVAAWGGDSTRGTGVLRVEEREAR
jgi:hypothetical protein